MEARQTRRLVTPERPMKTCTYCKRSLPLVAYTKNRHHKDGLNYHCITCQRVKNMARKENFVCNAGGR